MKRIKIFTGIVIFFILIKGFNLITCSSVYDGLINFTFFRYNKNVKKIEIIQNKILEFKPYHDSTGFRCFDRAPILLDSLRSNGYFAFPVYLCRVDNISDILFKKSIKSHVVIGVYLKGGVKFIGTNKKFLSSDSLNSKSIDDFDYNYLIPGVLNRKLTSIIYY